MTVAYLITVLWTAAALAWRNESSAAIGLTTIAMVHWFGVLIATAIRFIRRENIQP